MQGIYYIKNTVNGKIYIGQSVDIEARKQGHIYDLQGQRHKNHELQADYNKLGLDAFEFGILEKIEEKADLATSFTDGGYAQDSKEDQTKGNRASQGSFSRGISNKKTCSLFT